ncbi:hypothetical protein NQ318_001595 [Aromia moschata]|uniref:Uncharacterized protein n=1 Tax=Aromia moschata TaxID=1265417 RepID=A0AAV8Y2C3_9CUCU|nr:hypothetical protein NQ318_001595 [Aromia moschata]
MESTFGDTSRLVSSTEAEPHCNHIAVQPSLVLAWAQHIGPRRSRIFVTLSFGRLFFHNFCWLLFHFFITFNYFYRFFSSSSTTTSTPSTAPSTPASSTTPFRTHLAHSGTVSG